MNLSEIHKLVSFLILSAVKDPRLPVSEGTMRDGNRECSNSLVGFITAHDF